MSNSVANFLKSLKKQPLQLRNQIRISCGNESADLDSVASAISYAYLEHIWANSNPSEAIIPIINIPQSDLILRKDIILSLNRLNISVEDLFFREDLISFKKTNSNCIVNAILLDHNEIPKHTAPYIDNVVGIIDHHADSKLYLNANPRIIKVTGSCTSLIFKYWYEKIQPSTRPLLKNVAPLCLSAAVQDTANFKRKIEEADLEVAPIYRDLLPELQFDLFYNDLNEAKVDIKGLSTIDILRKDYKEFAFPDGKGDDLIVGIASVVKNLDWLYVNTNESQSKELFIKDCQQYLIDKKLTFLMIMANNRDPKKFERQIAFIFDKKMVGNIVDKVIRDVAEYLDLKPFDDSNTKDSYISFHQLNVKASRKQVAPAIKQAISKI
ncbi:hypothetical protein TBLA_0E04930 [Henningerozyma blattae CBS 6284]|uniref:DHHA2 domain-containing protein n=1 Tax=Henningerozyma blattae (strain ATCC 34711 / CBS 6284 / DSM 70876 / NBRC 10599 / NRRL Y-10934 / UCD 77-7) TaxID=1071380 RepID=I2H590_HENB6|nr:hypothetical protein TBLA_0E04930 [Tetrapisispora blattae CBS 6284]CCH61542.1 hypothetical protein TBLA_0E04930 [Tetrapisispora blattae CBS 6284]